MHTLPRNAGPAAEFLVRNLCRPIALDEQARYFAAAETENPGDDGWFWSDDNSKCLEFLAQPELWRRFAHESCEILRFVRAMCRGPFIFRRAATPRLDPVKAGNEIAAYRHSLLRLAWDPSAGAVTAGLRFHDERETDNLTLRGSWVEFTYRGRRRRLAVPTDGGTATAECSGQSLRLRYVAELLVDAGRHRRRLGEIAYSHVFPASSTVFAVEATLALDPGIEVSDVVLTIGQGGLAGCLFNTVATDRATAPLYAAGVPSQRQFDAGGAEYYAVRQSHISGDSLAVHSVPRAGQAVSRLETRVEIQGRLAEVDACYEFPGRHRGARLVAAEHKLITAGGFYDRIADYATLLREVAAGRDKACAAVDFSISYDYGATINAFAKCVALADREPALSPLAADELRSLFDERLGHYVALYVDRHESRPNAIFSRELAFALLGTATMLRVTGDARYQRQLRRLCDVLLDFELCFEDAEGRQAASFLMRKDNPDPGYLDCHSAALLALTQAAPFVDSGALSAVVERGIGSYRLAAAGPEGAGAETLALARRSGARQESAAWNFKAGLALRSFAALRRSPYPPLRAVAERHAARVAGFETLLRGQLAKSITRRGDGIEIRTSLASRETNSETQPWAMLGLVPHALD